MKPLITVDELRRLMPSLGLGTAGNFAPLLDAAMRECAIVSKPRRCAFLANLAVESTELTRWVENLNYSAPRLLEVFEKYFTPAQAKQYAHKPQAIANHVYANRMGNGDEASGDGWRNRGRGPIGLTGAKNYWRFGDLLGIDLVANPDLAMQPAYGFRIAALFWKLGGCNELADKLKLDGSKADRTVLTDITERINGGHNGLTERINYFRVAKQVLHGDEDPNGHTPTPAPAAPPAVRPAESVAEQEAADDDSTDLVSNALTSDKAKAAGLKLWPRLAKHGMAALTFLWAIAEAHKIVSLLGLVTLIAVIAWVVYHNRARVRALLLKVLK